MKDYEIIVETLRAACETLAHYTAREAVEFALVDVGKHRAEVLRPDLIKLMNVYGVETFTDLRRCYEAQRRAVEVNARPVVKEKS